MRFYRIRETLTEEEFNPGLSDEAPYVAVVTFREWMEQQDVFQLGIDMELNHNAVTKAEVNIDSLTGSFSIPDRKAPQKKDVNFSFALDEKGIIFIDDSGNADRLVRETVKKKQWKLPGLERFLYDFLENIVDGDLSLLESWEKKLSNAEEVILSDEDVNVLPEITWLRGDLLALRTHYEQLLDLGQELRENENEFFKEENLRYFDMFCARIMRLQDYVTSLRDMTVQVRDLYQSQLSVKQNNIMTVLTVVTVIFTPLTLIAGWYGMNFKYMPELSWRLSYPVLTIICLLISITCIIFFKKKKWL